jgi:hypothetical protein
MQCHGVFRPVLTVDTRPSLPMIDHDNILDDLDSILDGIAIFKSDTSSPINIAFEDDDGPNRPTAARNLVAIGELRSQCDAKNASKNRHVSFDKKSKKRLSVYQRLGANERPYGSQKQVVTDKHGEKENSVFNPSSDPIWKKREHPKRSDKKHPGKVKEDLARPHSPVVWVVEPNYEDRNKLHFKFTNDHGASLILTAAEAAVGVKVMQEETRGNTYFQVYSLDGTSSRVIGPEQIARSMEEIVCDSKSSLNEDDLMTISPRANRENRLDRRFYRFLLRRRCKNRVRRQTRIATMGNRAPRLAEMTRPFATLWERMSRRNEDAPTV